VVKIIAVGAIGAFVVSGPLQHLGVLPETPLGDASKSVIKMVLNSAVDDAFGRCGGGNIFKGNNGFGNGGLDPAPGRSADNSAPNAGQKREDRAR
jgi:hypothetical protein